MNNTKNRELVSIGEPRGQPLKQTKQGYECKAGFICETIGCRAMTVFLTEQSTGINS